MLKTLVNIVKITVFVILFVYALTLIFNFFSVDVELYGIYLAYFIALLIIYIMIPENNRVIFEKN